jgi:hypothetical protein
VQLIFLLAIDKEERLILSYGPAECATILDTTRYSSVTLCKETLPETLGDL